MFISLKTTIKKLSFIVSIKRKMSKTFLKVYYYAKLAAFKKALLVGLLAFRRITTQKSKQISRV